MVVSAAVEISESVQTTLDGIFDFLPKLVAALAIFIVGYFIARIIGRVLRTILERVGADKIVERDEIRPHAEKLGPGFTISGVVGKTVYLLVLAVVIIAAIGTLQIPALDEFVQDAIDYLPNVVVALAILAVAAWVASISGGLVRRAVGDSPLGQIAGTAVPAIVMVLAAFMILEQLSIAPEIVRITFAATMFSLALGLALAFGLGGRDVAKRVLEDAYEKQRSGGRAQPPGATPPADEP